jgi:hypothetical protein
MFPSADLQGAAEKAEQAISGTADTREGVRITARRLGIDPGIADSLYSRYGRTMQAKALCGLLGTTPEALRSDANKILGGAQNASQAPQKGKTGHSTKFPRLK